MPGADGAPVRRMMSRESGFGLPTEIAGGAAAWVLTYQEGGSSSPAERAGEIAARRRNGERGNVISTCNKQEPREEEFLLTDWREINIACANAIPPTTLAFPVQVANRGRRVYSPLNPKDIQAIVKAVSDKGLHSAMASTLIDGVFGGDDLLPFDIKQACRLMGP